MSSNFFNPSGSAPPWPGICKSKKKPKPKPPAFPPEAITVILSLNWIDPLEGPQNWTGSVPCIAGGTGAPSWSGAHNNPPEAVSVLFQTGAVGESPGTQITAQLPHSSQQLHYNGNTANSTSLTPFVSGVIPIDGIGIEEPSTAAAFG